jgi:hypothetical protein
VLRLDTGDDVMAKRENQLVAIQIEFADPDGKFTHHPSRCMLPIVLPGGPYAEHNRQAVFDSASEWDMFRGVALQVRIVYRWRSRNHLWRWCNQGGNFFKVVGFIKRQTGWEL